MSSPEEVLGIETTVPSTHLSGAHRCGAQRSASASRGCCAQLPRAPWLGAAQLLSLAAMKLEETQNLSH